ncbi:chordin [Heptranchias perlo]|uniref:chordin n=1 Tax=Heptranchias perlo TaxID=212740 RepID=UPI0035594E09
MKTVYLVSVLHLVFIFKLMSEAVGFRPKIPSLPIRAEDDLVHSKGAAGCSFGGKLYALEDTWHPDLGQPFGVMHCVVCHCEPQRNRRGKFNGKVSCRNIKHDCPEPPCRTPVLLPGHCCKTCPKENASSSEKKPEYLFDGLEYFPLEKEDDLQKSYNDRSYISSEDISMDDSRTDFVALLTETSVHSSASRGVAKARFTLVRSNLIFAIHYERLSRPIRVSFRDRDGTVLFEHPVHKTSSPQNNLICGMWRNVHKPYIKLLKSDQLQVALMTQPRPDTGIQGKIVKHRALFAETFSSVLTSTDLDRSGLGGIAMLTLSDVENNLHFIIMFAGLLKKTEKDRSLVPVRVQLLYRNRPLREVRANVTTNDYDFAEVLTDLSNKEMFLLSRGQLEIALETEGRNTDRISGFITGKKTCDTIQSVLSGGNALTPTKTGAVGSAKFILHDNGTLEYQVQVAGTASEVIGLTIETKPRRRNRRNILHDITSDYRNNFAIGVSDSLNARDIHMLLQNELFINIATKEYEEGELRGQISSLLYSGLQARYYELPIPLAGQFVVPPIKTGSAGHAWVSLDEHCHLHYEIAVAGLSKAEDITINAHLHGFAEIGEMDDNSGEHKRLLKGFYGSEAQGILKDISTELLRHLNRGTAFIQVSTKLNPKGEIRGPVLIRNQCESKGFVIPKEPEFEDGLFQEIKPDPEELKKDPNSCFFEGQQRAHGSQWAPDYDRKCSICSCQKRTVICDPIICLPLNCSEIVQLEDKCCPVCKDKIEAKDEKKTEADQVEGCYFDGDRKWHPAGTTWHPFVPPFGYVKCAVCTCKGATGEVHCEKVQCPLLPCSQPVRRNASNCCKECPVTGITPFDHTDMMQADGPRPCKFGRHIYMNNNKWHPEVPPFGEMKCITCWCDEGSTKCQREKCPVLTCENIVKRQHKCCPECEGLTSYFDEDGEKLKDQKKGKSSWGSKP